MANILVADVDGGYQRLSQAVSGRHTLIRVETLEQFQSVLNNDQRSHHIDLVIVGVHFDESRMFDGLAAIKENPQWQDIPVVCFRAINTELSNLTKQPMNAACVALGAEGYLDWVEIEKQCDNPDFELLCEIERHLPKQVQTETACEQRNELLHGSCELQLENVNRRSARPKRE